jgi:hypothetical protein
MTNLFLRVMAIAAVAAAIGCSASSLQGPTDAGPLGGSRGGGLPGTGSGTGAGGATGSSPAGLAGATGGGNVGVGSSTGQGGTIAIGGTGGAPARDAAVDVVIGPGAPDADPPLPPGMSAVEPPDVSCTGAEDAGVECDLPPSSCSIPMTCTGDPRGCMAGSQWIVYYENPRCVSHKCVWDQMYYQCANGSTCNGGVCITIITTA